MERTLKSMFCAMGTEARLRIIQLLLSAPPDGLVVGESQQEPGFRTPPCPTPLVMLKGGRLASSPTAIDLSAETAWPQGKK